jgi:hypothetical protein
MIKINLLIAALAALFPLVLGFIWYNPKVFGTAWMNASGMTPEKAKGANMPVIFGVTYLFCFFVAVFLETLTIHQMGFQSMLFGEKDLLTPGSEANTLFTTVMAKYGSAFHTFKHGALHGTLTGIFFALPVLGINALFERKGFKYIAINAGYWIVSLAIMGGIVCGFF